MPLTQTQLVAAVAERADLTKADAKRALAALDEVLLAEIGNAQKVRIGGLVQLTPRVKPATKKRQGRNPATGERSRSPPSPRASTSGPGRSPRPRAPCRRFRKPAVGWLPNPALLLTDRPRLRPAGQLRGGRRVAACVDQEAGERQPVAVGVKRLPAVA